MNPNRKIRVIKRTERGVEQSAPEAQAQGGEQDARRPNRDAASRVSAWVKEFKQRRVADPRRAFASLFAEPALNQ
ncbi:MAG TPA: hypothetical protein VF735_02705 [Pyrinomonadaceae bacterium]|jgi:hypothetical protein